MADVVCEFFENRYPLAEKGTLIRTSDDNCAHSLMERSSSLKALYDPA